MAKHLRDDEFDPASIVECPDCGWRGPAAEQIEFYDALYDVTCPECSKMILIVRYTGTHEPARSAIGDIAGGHIQLVGSTEPVEPYTDAMARRIAAPGEFPEIDAPTFRVAWDFQEVNGDAWPQWTVLRVADREIAREPAFWEGIDRFEEVLDLLVRRYGERLLALVPTNASKLYLYGDRLRAPQDVEALNAALPRLAP